MLKPAMLRVALALTSELIGDMAQIHQHDYVMKNPKIIICEIDNEPSVTDIIQCSANSFQTVELIGR